MFDRLPVCIGRWNKSRVSRDMQAALQSFLEAPTAGNYRRVREVLHDELSSSPAAAELAEIAAHSNAGDHASVLERMDDLMPAWSLSPRLHFYAALAAERLGDVETAELERFVFQACLEGMLATGEGTAESPYSITYLSDEYDLLTALGLEPRSQTMLDRAGLLCDVVKCLDGEEIWFELTGLVHDPRQRQLEFALLSGMRR